MKTKHYSLLALSLLMGYGLTCSAEGNHASHQKPTKHIKALPPSGPDSNSSKITDFAHSQDMNPNDNFMQDVHCCTINSAKRQNTGCIPEPAASAVGYMGFKVGDKVKWETTPDKTFTNSFVTGTIDLLDSDRCYIAIDNTHRVTVKPYGDIEKTNP